jgi:hypothetical protein
LIGGGSVAARGRTRSSVREVPDFFWPYLLPHLNANRHLRSFEPAASSALGNEDKRRGVMREAEASETRERDSSVHTESSAMGGVAKELDVAASEGVVGMAQVM